MGNHPTTIGNSRIERMKEAEEKGMADTYSSPNQTNCFQ